MRRTSSHPLPTALTPPPAAVLPARARRVVRRSLLAGGLLLLLTLVTVTVIRGVRPGDTGVAGVPTTTVLLQFQSARQDAALPVYRGLLDSMPATTRFVIAVGPGAEAASLAAGLGAERMADPRIQVLSVHGPLGPWARDRYLPFLKAGVPHLFVPPEHLVHPMERGSLEVAAFLPTVIAGLEIVRPELNLEGGDLILTEKHVFIGATTVRRTTGGNGELRRAFQAELRTLFGRDVVVVGSASRSLPYDHIDMFFSALDDRTVFLGDPLLAVKLLWPGRPAPDVLFDDDLGRFLRTRQEQIAQRYTELAAELVGKGFHVVRLPILHGEPWADGRRGAVLNWNNALLDRAGARAYLPRYGVGVLDDYAQAVWREEGVMPFPIDARAAIVRGGAIRCLTAAFFGSKRPSRLTP